MMMISNGAATDLINGEARRAPLSITYVDRKPRHSAKVPHKLRLAPRIEKGFVI